MTDRTDEMERLLNGGASLPLGLFPISRPLVVIGSDPNNEGHYMAGDGKMAVGILRKIVERPGAIYEGGFGVYIESEALDLTDEELAFLKVLSDAEEP